MASEHGKVELDSIPECYEKKAFIDFAKKHNALVDDTSALKNDLDLVTGTTPEEKAQMYGLIGKLRLALKWLHGKRFNMLGWSAFLYLALGILQKFGLTPEQGTRFFEAILKFIEKNSGV